MTVIRSEQMVALLDSKAMRCVGFLVKDLPRDEERWRFISAAAVAGA